MTGIGTPISQSKHPLPIVHPLAVTPDNEHRRFAFRLAPRYPAGPISFCAK